MNHFAKRCALLAAVSVGALWTSFQTDAAPRPYAIDAMHTTVGFEVAHMMISSVEGKFDSFGGDFTFDPSDFTKTSLNAWADVTTVDTGVKDRDDHLRSPDFFDVAKYPKMTFVSKSVKKTGDKTFDLAGDMTIHGVTKPVVFAVTYKGEVNMPQGIVQAFKATTKINRKEFGMNFNKMAESVVLVGDEVTITISTEGVLKKTVAENIEKSNG